MAERFAPTKTKRLHRTRALRGKGICMRSKVFLYDHTHFREAATGPACK